MWELSPLFEAQQFNEWVTVYLSAYASESGHFVPYVMARKLFVMVIIRKEHSAFSAAPAKVWTPKRQLPREVISPERIETVPLIVPFEGAEADQKLYVLLSFDAIRGNILHLSTNFTQHPVGETLRYLWRGNIEPDLDRSDIVKHVDMREMQFYNAVSSMRFSMEVRYSNVTPMVLFCVRLYQLMGIFGC